MQTGAILGLIGDLFAFTGALLLTLDALSKEYEFRRIKRITSALKSQNLAKLKLEVGGVVLTDENDVEAVFVRNSAKKAIIGSVLLGIGFFLIIVGRILDYSK